MQQNVYKLLNELQNVQTKFNGFKIPKKLKVTQAMYNSIKQDIGNRPPLDNRPCYNKIRVEIDNDMKEPFKFVY